MMLYNIIIKKNKNGDFKNEIEFYRDNLEWICD